MNTSKLSQAHVYIIGLVIAFILALGLYFLMISPVAGDIDTQTRANNSAKQSLGNLPPEQAVKKAQNAKKEAEVKAKAKAAQYYAVIARQSTPPDHPIPTGPYEARLPLMAGWWTLPEYVVRDATGFAHQQHGVLVSTDFKGMAPSPDPMAVQGFPLVMNLGAMTATGSFNQVLDWATRWNNYHFTPAVDGLALRLIGKGTVQAAANLTLYIWSKEKPGAAPAGGAGAGGSGGPMMGSGGPMMGSGGPMMGSGGPMMGSGGPMMSSGGTGTPGGKGAGMAAP